MPARTVLTRPSPEMFQKLKAHIMNRRKKIKEELEADAEVERQRKEALLKQKENDMTLGETLEQIKHLEKNLSALKEEKHQMFLQLKKVLNEDDNRRKQQLIRQQEASANAEMYSALCCPVQPIAPPPPPPPAQPQAPPVAQQPQQPMESHISPLMIASNYAVGDRNLYKMPPHSVHPSNPLKRKCSSPSPPQKVYPQNYAHKSSESRLNYGKPTSSNYAAYYGGTVPISGAGSYSYPGPPYQQTHVQIPRSELATHATPESLQQSKHSIYMNQQQAPPPPSSHQQQPPPPLTQISRPPVLSQGYIHPPPLEHTKSVYGEDKYYPMATIRPTSHVPIHSGAIPLQQPQSLKTGGISTGYPIRSQSSSALSTTHRNIAVVPPICHSNSSSSGRILQSQTTPTHHISAHPSQAHALHGPSHPNPSPSNRYIPREMY